MAGASASTADPTIERARASYQARRLDEAEAICREILALDPRNADAESLLGVIATQTGRAELALAHFAAALAQWPGNPAFHFHEGNALFRLARFDAAEASYGRALEIHPDYFDAHYNCGNARRSAGRHREAIASFDAALALKPDFVPAHYNRANALRSLGSNEAAIAGYDQAIDLQPDFAAAYHNRGNAGQALGRHEAAVADYTQAIAIDPDRADPYLHRAISLGELNRLDAARADLDRSLGLRPDDASAHAYLGQVLGRLHRHEEAIASFDRALALSPDMTSVLGPRLFAKLQICDWRGFDRDRRRLAAAVGRMQEPTHPFYLLASSGSAALQRLAAQRWVEAHCAPDRTLGAVVDPGAQPRIRIGYFSADFRRHPVARLAAELIETHDRERFEIIGFAFGPETRDEMRTRLKRAFDRWIDVREASDHEIAALARRLGVHIAVDLGGFTENARTRVFALRAAPVQVSYLGYLGTMGAPFIDYLIADRVTVPRSARRHYVENLVYLPSYQVNDTRRRAAERGLAREALGIGATDFVFCCFNAVYKISPSIFGSWMRILRRVPAAILLLQADDPTARVNLAAEAARRGVDPKRILFAARVPYEDYLARYRTADLFLDTLPYNAGATASDALWAGLPVLTRAGRTFAGRVAASLLRAVGLSELVANSSAQYEQLAVEFATNPARLAGVRACLAAPMRRSAKLFDTPAFVRSLESAYAMMHARSRAGLPPAPLYVNAGRVRGEPRANRPTGYPCRARPVRPQVTTMAANPSPVIPTLLAGE